MKKVKPSITVSEYKTPSNKTGLISLDVLVNRFRNKKTSCIILKGVKFLNGKSDMIYLVDRGQNRSSLENIYRNKEKISIAKKNSVRNSYFEFVTWDILRLNDGQITGSNVNMFSDKDEHKCYMVNNI